MTINTMLGAIEPSKLGRTLMHEHVYTLLAELHFDYEFDTDAEDARAVEKLRELKAAGFDAIVDMTVIGLGRWISRVLPIARQCGITIVPATGIYTTRDLPAHFRSATAEISPDYIADFLTRDIVEGIGETGVRAGIIKFAVDKPGITDDLALLIRQSAKAQLATGVPISTHTDAATKQGLAQQAALREAGVDLGRVVIGHSGDATDIGYLEQLIENGSWIGMDRFGDLPLALDKRIDVLIKMCRRGYASRMVISHDTNVTSDNTVAEARLKPEREHWNYLCIPEIVLPALRAAGVSEADIDTMTIANPRDILTPG
jgi:phosphotriesterase-related protein